MKWLTGFAEVWLRLILIFFGKNQIMHGYPLLPQTKKWQEAKSQTQIILGEVIYFILFFYFLCCRALPPPCCCFADRRGHQYRSDPHNHTNRELSSLICEHIKHTTWRWATFVELLQSVWYQYHTVCLSERCFPEHGTWPDGHRSGGKRLHGIGKLRHIRYTTSSHGFQSRTIKLTQLGHNKRQIDSQMTSLRFALFIHSSDTYSEE